MKLRSAGILFIVIIFAHIPLRSLGWGMTGHRIVGEIAERYLTANTKAEIKKILGNESIAMASNWADFIKSDSNFRYLEPWHYINFPKGLSYDQMKESLKNDTAVNAYTQIRFLIRELKKKNLHVSKKRSYLRLLIHLIGDIHQPLHASPEGTRGGNDIKVLWFDKPTNLHTVWDTYLIDHQQLSYTEYSKAINFTTVNERRSLQKDPISKWLFESYTLATKLHDQIDAPNQKLSYRYNYEHNETLNKQLLKGGVRLAGILNEIYN